MSSKIADSDKEWIEMFNEFSREFYFKRYMVTFKPTSAISSIVLPSDRHEMKIGINLLTKIDKKQIESIEDLNEQVLALIAVVEDPIKHHYEITKQQTIETAIKYFGRNSIDINNSNNIAIQLVDYISAFCDDDDFSFQDAMKVIVQNQQKYADDFINRLLGSIVPILVERREDKEFNEDIKNVVDDFIKHDLDMMVIDVATEKQRQKNK